MKSANSRTELQTADVFLPFCVSFSRFSRKVRKAFIGSATEPLSYPHPLRAHAHAFLPRRQHTAIQSDSFLPARPPTKETMTTTFIDVLFSKESALHKSRP